MNLTREEKIKTLRTVQEWAGGQLNALGEPLVPAGATPTVAPPMGEHASFLRNEMGWLSLTLMSIARILEQPPTETMKELPAHAEKVMAELKSLKQNPTSP